MAKNDVTTRLLGAPKSLLKALKDGEGGLKQFGKTAGSVAKGVATGFAGLATIGVGAAIGLTKIGEGFDTEFDKIRVGTGATGEALEGLKSDFKDVLSTVPTDAASAGTAIADLNTRLGLTGDALETSATQFLNLGRISGGDVATQIEKVSRTFGDWNVATENQEDALDRIFRASQASGVGIEELSGQLVQFGAPLRNLGFDIDESSALLAQFGKAGVNTETVFAGLKAGVGSLAKAGEDVPSTFRRIVEEIGELGPTSESTRLAIKLFGQDAGPDLADAITGGKFAIDDMLTAIRDGEDTINTAAKDTESFGEKWQLIKNRVLVGIEPLATRVFEGVGTAMDRLGPIIDRVVEGVGTIVAGFTGASDGTSGLASFGARIGEVVAFVQANWPQVRDLIVETVRNIIAFVQENWPPVWARVRTVLAGIIDFVRTNWPEISATIEAVIERVLDIVASVTELIAVVWEKWGDELLLVISVVTEVIIDVVTKALDFISAVIETVTAVISGDWDRAWDGIKAVVATAWELIKAVVSGALEILKTGIKLALEGIKTAMGGIWGDISSSVSGTWETIKSTIGTAIDGIVGFVVELPGRITSAAAGIWDGITDGFKTAINTIIDGWNNLSFTLPKIDLGPLGSVGGFTISTPNLPRLADGAALFGETLFIGGDNRNARYDPELVGSASDVERYIGLAVDRVFAERGLTGGLLDQSPRFLIEKVVAEPGRTVEQELTDLWNQTL